MTEAISSLLTLAVPFQKASIIFSMLLISKPSPRTPFLDTYSFTSLHSGAREADILDRCCQDSGPKADPTAPRFRGSTGKLAEAVEITRYACRPSIRYELPVVEAIAARSKGQIEFIALQSLHRQPGSVEPDR
jgi:hypothetical protein